MFPHFSSGGVAGLRGCSHLASLTLEAASTNLNPDAVNAIGGACPNLTTLRLISKATGADLAWVPWSLPDLVRAPS